jgi:hypothetical protein
MYQSLGASTRRQSPDDSRRVALLLVIGVLLVILGVGLASAEIPARTVHLSSEDAARSGSLVGMTLRAAGGSALLQVQPSDGATSLLAVSPDGGQAALADRVGDLSGTLTLAKPDGSQVRVSFPGLLGAGYATDGAWLAVLDGRGALWEVDSANGEAVQLAEGPFLGTPIVAKDGSLMLLSVPSVEAPYRSRLIRFVPSSGAITTLASDDLVYAGYPLDDGTLAVVAHTPVGTVVRRVGPHIAQVLADLGPGAINVGVAGDGRHIAFEKEGHGILMVDRPGGSARIVGVGSRPCFAPDSSLLLVRRVDESAALSVDGSVLAITPRLTGIVGSSGCLP